MEVHTIAPSASEKMLRPCLTLIFFFVPLSHNILQSHQPAVQHSVRVLHGRDVPRHVRLQHVSPAAALFWIINARCAIHYSSHSSREQHRKGNLTPLSVTLRGRYQGLRSRPSSVLYSWQMKWEVSCFDLADRDETGEIKVLGAQETRVCACLFLAFCEDQMLW